LCLNQAGQEQFSSQARIIPSIFAIFTSERHLKVLSEKDNAVIFGTAIDELIRHHPTLKDRVFSAISDVFRKIEEIGQGYVDDKDVESHYRLVLVSNESQPEARMEVTESSSAAVEGTETPEAVMEGEQSKQDPSDNIVVAFIDVMSRVRCFSIAI
jgi:E3 ubiquitin-protein ligase HUWE1